MEDYSIDFILEIKIYTYRNSKVNYYGRKNILKIKYKPKGIVALYYYYKHLLGLYKKNNVTHKLSEQMRKDISKMEHYSEVIRFLCKYKLEVVDNVYELKNRKLKEFQEILNTGNRLYYKRVNTDNESEKEQITRQIIEVTKELDKVKKEIKMCDEVGDDSIKLKENIRQVEKKEKKKVQKKKESIIGKTDREI